MPGAIAACGKPVDFSGEGNGSLAALIHGFSTIGTPRFEIANYSEHALSSGETASAISCIQIKRPDGKSRWGRAWTRTSNYFPCARC